MDAARTHAHLSQPMLSACTERKQAGIIPILLLTTDTLTSYGVEYLLRPKGVQVTWIKEIMGFNFNYTPENEI